MLALDLDHPVLRVGCLSATIQAGDSPPGLLALLDADATTPLPTFDREAVKTTIRTLLRAAGYKPSGRGKPASEYLFGVATREGRLGTISNLVDVNNVVSLHSGIPMSILDLDRMEPPLSLRYGSEDERYVFNTAGQEIRLDGLMTVCDRGGLRPLGNPVKDAMDAKTGAETHRVVAIAYGSSDLPEGLLEGALEWYRTLLETHCAATDVERHSP